MGSRNSSRRISPGGTAKTLSMGGPVVVYDLDVVGGALVPDEVLGATYTFVSSNDTSGGCRFFRSRALCYTFGMRLQFFGPSLVAGVAAMFAACPTLLSAQQTLLATPSTVAWGYYSAHAKPALTVKSGDTVVMQTLSTC